MEPRIDYEDLSSLMEHFSTIKSTKLPKFDFQNAEERPLILPFLRENGVVIVKNAMPPHKPEKARAVVEAFLDKNQMRDPETNRIISSEAKGILLTGFTAVTHHQDFLRCVEAPELKLLM